MNLKYAIQNAEMVHRIASLIILLLWVGLAGVRGGVRSGAGALIAFGLPTICIWFPEAMARYKGMTIDSMHSVDEESHPTVLRFVCWFFLLGVPLIIWGISRAA